MLKSEGLDTTNLSFAIADLTKADGWDEAMGNIDYVLHVASPLGVIIMKIRGLYRLQKVEWKMFLMRQLRQALRK